MENFPIDFVVTWVDGNDMKWLEKKNKFTNSNRVGGEFDSKNRYRDFGLLKYWFRSVEKYAPWVNHVYLVTDKQIPEFLDLAYEKLTIVDHSEIIDKEYLPTFNSNTIDLNLHKIKNLSENFVYFNDDVYLNAPVKPKDFFYDKNTIKDTISQSVIMPLENYDHTIVNNVILLNKNFDKKDVLKNNWKKFLSIKQGFSLFIINLLLLPFPRFTRIYDPHTAISLLKSEMQNALEISQSEAELTFKNRTRGLEDISIQWIRYYLICKKKVHSRSLKFSFATQSNELNLISVKSRKSINKTLLVQDDLNMTDQDANNLLEIFDDKFKEKSKFEK